MPRREQSAAARRRLRRQFARVGLRGSHGTAANHHLHLLPAIRKRGRRRSTRRARILHHDNRAARRRRRGVLQRRPCLRHRRRASQPRRSADQLLGRIRHHERIWQQHSPGQRRCERRTGKGADRTGRASARNHLSLQGPRSQRQWDRVRPRRHADDVSRRAARPARWPRLRTGDSGAQRKRGGVRATSRQPDRRSRRDGPAGSAPRRTATPSPMPGIPPPEGTAVRVLAVATSTWRAAMPTADGPRPTCSRTVSPRRPMFSSRATSRSASSAPTKRFPPAPRRTAKISTREPRMAPSIRSSPGSSPKKCSSPRSKAIRAI